MDYVLIALGAFWATRLARIYLADAPAWVWDIFVFLPTIGLVFLFDMQREWYAIPSLAGASALIQRIEDLLTIKTDEALVNVRRRR